MSAPDFEPSEDTLARIAATVSARIDRSRRRARLGLGVATGVAAVLTVAGVGIALQPVTSQVDCYAGGDTSSLTTRSDLEPGAGSPIDRALAQCASITAADARAESGGDGAAGSSTASSTETQSSDAGASTLSQPEAEYLVCRHEADYGVLTLDPAARIDPVAACAAIGMEPAE
jgi:hypothetical protein